MKKIFILAVILLVLYQIADKYFPERMAELTAIIGNPIDYLRGETQKDNKRQEEKKAQWDEYQRLKEEQKSKYQDTMERASEELRRQEELAKEQLADRMKALDDRRRQEKLAREQLAERVKALDKQNKWDIEALKRKKK